MRAFICVGVCILLSTLGQVRGEERNSLTVEALYMQCKAPQHSEEWAICVGYVSGVMDFMNLVAVKAKTEAPKTEVELRSLASCSEPEAASHGAGIQAFINWAERNPASWSIPMVAGVAIALQETWPCRPPNRNTKP